MPNMGYRTRYDFTLLLVPLLLRVLEIPPRIHSAWLLDTCFHFSLIQQIGLTWMQALLFNIYIGLFTAAESNLSFRIAQKKNRACMS